MANDDDTEKYESKTYYTRIPGWASAQVETYIDETGMSNSKAVSKLVQRGLTEQTLVEQLARQLITIPIATLAILASVYVFSTLGEIVGVISSTSQIVAQVYFLILGPSFLAVAAIAYTFIKTGYAKKLGMKLGFTDINPEPGSD